MIFQMTGVSNKTVLNGNILPCFRNPAGYVFFLFLPLTVLTNGYSQPVFYSQSLHKLYYSLPASCRLENPVADTVMSCAGILPGMNVPVAYSWDGYGILAHVGYRFLQSVDSLPFHPAVVRFLERELLILLSTDNLEQKLNTNRENSLVLLHNGNTPQRGFYRDRNGLPLLLQTVSGMDVRYLEGRKYEVRLACGQEQTLIFQFFADAELLSDMDKKERDERIAAQLIHHRAKNGNMSPLVPACDGASMQIFLDTLYVCQGKSFIIPQINDNLYYLKTGDIFELVFSSRWAVASFQNAMLSSAGHNYTVQITHRQYGGVIRRYEMKSRDFFDYFSDDYDRYFGIETLERDVLSGTLIFADRSSGSLHIAYVTVGLWELLNGGVVEMNLNTNIPQHNIENLFGKRDK